MNLSDYYNPIICAAILGWAAAQLLKFILYFAQNTSINVERLYGSGGMPSSHSALVCAAFVSTGREQGWNSAALGIVFVLSCIVMYDAANVRLEAGKHAKQLHEIMLRLFSQEQDPDSKKKEFKELLGHTPLQVACGAALGLVIGALIPL